MSHIFSQNDEANTFFLKARNNQKASKAFGFMALGIVGATMIYGATAPEPRSCRNNPFFFSSQGIQCASDGLDQAAVAALMLLGASVSGVISLVFKLVGKKKRNKSIEVFNQDYGLKLPKENPIEVQLVLSNGLGLKMRF